MQKISQEQINAFVGAAHGDLSTVSNLLAEYPEIVNMEAAWGETAIQAASQTGREDIISILLAAGAPMDICTAAVLGKKDLVEELLRTDPGLAGALGAHGIPLMYFPVIKGHREIAEKILAAGGSVNGGEGVTPPLHGAVAFDQPDMARWLLQNGARTDSLNFKNQTPLKAAEELQNQGLIDLLSRVVVE